MKYVQVQYQKIDGGFFATYHDENDHYLGMTRVSQFLAPLMGHVNKQLAVWLN